ncbi:MAG: dihydropyrimidinase [Candidatus Jordarchaeum sp.]|uniref:dihydropyrimidinase n=1 Tax=Candidatus Jordarchaeum sp. TaxID=2823881 RepID=UPI004049313A
MELVIKNGKIVLPSGVFEANVAVDNGEIVSLGKTELKADKVIDASGKLVLPGLIDSHSHIAQPFQGAIPKETWETGSISAAFGGITTVLDFVAQLDPITYEKLGVMGDIKRKEETAGKQAVIDFAFHGIFVDFSDMNIVLKEMEEAVKYGYPSFKEFMTYLLLAVSDWNLYRILSKAKEIGATVGVHAENYPLEEGMVKKFVEEGKKEPKYHPLSKPNLVEAEAIQRAILLAEWAQSRIYIAHMSTKEGVELVKNARLRGSTIYAETCPQYLTLTDDLYERPDGANFIISPPLRKKEDNEALWKALAEGYVALYGSDHVPLPSEAKMAAKSFNETPNGAPGNELMLPILYSEGVNKGRISLPRLVEVSSLNASKLFGLYPKKGLVAPGFDADIVILDPKLKKTVRLEDLHMDIDYVNWEGWKLTGWPTVVISRGTLVIEDGQLVGKPGHGKPVKGKIDEELIKTVR